MRHAAPVLSLPLALLVACGQAAAPPQGPNVVEVTAHEFAYTMPDTLPAGWTTFRMTNTGQELHHVTVIRLEQGKTMGDFLQAMGAVTSGGALPEWAVFMGGPNAVIGPMVSEVTMDLPAGNYAVVCVIPSPSDGVPHVAKGMSHALTVVPSEVVRTAPTEDVTLTLADYSFTWSAPLTAGRHVVKIVNTAQQGHELILFRIAAEKAMTDVLHWFELFEGGQNPGAPPFTPWGGIGFMNPGVVNYMTVDVEPGEYAQLCVVPDMRDGKPHVAHGMVSQLSVR